MHMSINCHLLTPRWQLLTKLAQRENQSTLRKSGNNTSIYASIDLTFPFLEKKKIAYKKDGIWLLRVRLCPWKNFCVLLDPYSTPPSSPSTILTINRSSIRLWAPPFPHNFWSRCTGLGNASTKTSWIQNSYLLQICRWHPTCCTSYPI